MSSDNTTTCGGYLHLEHIGTFQILANKGKGDCLFRSISQAIHNNSESFHTQLRHQIQHYKQVPLFWNPNSNGTILSKLCSRFHNTRRRHRSSHVDQSGTFQQLVLASNLFSFRFALVNTPVHPRGHDYHYDPHQEPSLYQFQIHGHTNGDENWGNASPDNTMLNTKGNGFHFFFHSRDDENQEGHWELIRPLFSIG